MSAHRPEDLVRMLQAYLGDEDDPRGRKRRRIIEAARRLFIRHGDRKAGVEDVAREAGVGKGTVYLYFRTKTDLLVHAIVAEKARYVSRVTDVLDEARPPRERLREWLRLTFVVVHEMPLISKLMRGDREILAALSETETLDGIPVGEFQVGFLSDLLAEVAPGVWSAEALADRARVLLGLAYSASLVSDPQVRGGLELDRYAALLADLLVDGVPSSTPAVRPAGPARTSAAAARSDTPSVPRRPRRRAKGGGS